MLSFLSFCIYANVDIWIIKELTDCVTSASPATKEIQTPPILKGRERERKKEKKKKRKKEREVTENNIKMKSW